MNPYQFMVVANGIRSGFYYGNGNVTIKDSLNLRFVHRIEPRGYHVIYSHTIRLWVDSELSWITVDL
jgi:hypothetical protein